MTFLDKVIADETSSGLLFISTTSAASIATSVPAPIAIPVLALVSAGASFMPSPTIATLPYSESKRTFSSLPSGNTFEIILLIPTCLPIALAVSSLSPVIITTETPILFRFSTACLLVSLTVSATAITPKNFLSAAKNKGVFPIPESSFA